MKCKNNLLVKSRIFHFNISGLFIDIYSVQEFDSNKLVPLWKMSEWLVLFLNSFFGSPDYNSGNFKLCHNLWCNLKCLV